MVTPYLCFRWSAIYIFFYSKFSNTWKSLRIASLRLASVNSYDDKFLLLSFSYKSRGGSSVLHGQPMSQDQIIASHQNSENKEKMTLKAVTLDTCDDKAEQRAQSVSTVFQRRTEEGQWGLMDVQQYGEMNGQEELMRQQEDEAGQFSAIGLWW